MQHTGLTVGGFTQPIVARNILENQANVEKGLCQRFYGSFLNPPVLLLKI